MKFLQCLLLLQLTSDFFMHLASRCSPPLAEAYYKPAPESLLRDKGFIREVAAQANIPQPVYRLYRQDNATGDNPHAFSQWICAQKVPVYLKPTSCMRGELVTRFEPTARGMTVRSNCPTAQSIISSVVHTRVPLAVLGKALSTIATSSPIPHHLQSVLHCTSYLLSGGCSLSYVEAKRVIGALINLTTEEHHRGFDWIAEHDIAPNRSPLKRNVEHSFVFAGSATLRGSYGKVSCGAAVAGNLARGATPTTTEQAMRLELPQLSEAQRQAIKSRIERYIPEMVSKFVDASYQLAPQLKAVGHPLRRNVFRVDMRFSQGGTEPRLVEIQCDLPGCRLGLKGLHHTDPGAYNAVIGLTNSAHENDPNRRESFGGE